MIKKFSVQHLVGIAGAMASGLVVGCSSTPRVDEVGDVDTDSVNAEQLITSTNDAGVWTADAVQPSQTVEGSAFYVNGSATFTGPSGAQRKMGFCLLQQYLPAKTCTTLTSGTPEEKQAWVDSQCATAPSSVPSGGFRYCTAPNGTGSKYCFYRPGPGTTWCAGSPVDGQPKQPGSFSVKSRLAATSTWISYACFEGCKVEDPSSSSSAKALVVRELPPDPNCPPCKQYPCLPCPPQK